MDLDYNALTLIIGLFSAISAIVALIIESRRSRITLQTDLLLKLDDKFYAPEMIEKRKVAAKKLLKEEFPNPELDDLLDCFSTIAYLVECKAINMDLTWKIFEYDIIRYWYCAEKHIRKTRRVDPETWSTLQRLVKKLEDMNAKKGRPPLTKEELTRFLKEEAQV
jgi:hypothetical protein